MKDRRQQRVAERMGRPSGRGMGQQDAKVERLVGWPAVHTLGAWKAPAEEPAAFSSPQGHQTAG